MNTIGPLAENGLTRDCGLSTGLEEMMSNSDRLDIAECDKVKVVFVKGIDKSCQIHTQSTSTVEELKQIVSTRLQIPLHFLLTLNGKILPNSTLLKSLFTPTTPFLDLSIYIQTLGGKGGFGSQLKAQGGRMANKKTTNFESCRDLSGRRLKVVNDAKRLADYIEKEPERVKAKEAREIDGKVGKKREDASVIKKVVDEPSFREILERELDEVDDALKIGLKRPRVGKKVSRKPVLDLPDLSD